MQSVQIVSGHDSLRRMEHLYREAEERRKLWPYPHIYPPTQSINVHQIGTKATQAQGAAPLVVVIYQVSSGKRLYLRSILLGYQGTSGFNVGDLLFTIDRSGLNSSNTQFLPVHGLVNIPVLLGDPQVSPWPLERAIEFEPLDVVRIKGTNISAPVGAPNNYVCGLFGYEVPVL